jgi:hypothetical protein
MQKFRLFLFLSVLFVFVPSFAYAWGPVTHIYLGTEVFFLSSILPAGVYNILKKYRQDFLYGNLMADFILGKKYLPPEKSSHCWEVGFRILDSAKTQSEKAFSYGYLGHLAADTVAHDMLTKGVKNIEHTFLELKADSLIDRRYWAQAVRIERQVQTRNDLFLERSSPERVIFSFNTNKRIFKGIVILSGLNKERLGNFMERNLMFPPAFKRHNLAKLHEESLDRIVDVLRNKDKSHVVKKNPIGSPARGRIIKYLVS